MAFGIDDIVGGALSGLGGLVGGLFGGNAETPAPHERPYGRQQEDLQFLSSLGRLARSGSPYPGMMLSGSGNQSDAMRNAMNNIVGGYNVVEGKPIGKLPVRGELGPESDKYYNERMRGTPAIYALYGEGNTGGFFK